MAPHHLDRAVIKLFAVDDETGMFGHLVAEGG